MLMQASDGELRYMACHTLLVGHARVMNLVPTTTSSRAASSRQPQDGTITTTQSADPVLHKLVEDKDPELGLYPALVGHGALPSQASMQGDVHAQDAPNSLGLSRQGMHARAEGTQDALVLTDARMAQLHAFTAAVQSIATVLSRKHECNSVLQAVMERHMHAVHAGE